VLKATSRRDPVKALLRNRMIANHVLVAASYWQRGSLVNCLKPSWKGAFTLVGPANVLPCMSYTRKAELTISTTKPFPTQRP
jgi:hypothetical protein